MAKHMAPKRRGRAMAPGTRGSGMRVAAIAVGIVALVAVALVVACALPRFVGPRDDRDGAQTTEEQSAAASEENGMTTESQARPKVAQLFLAGEVKSVRLIGDSITAGFGTEGYEDGDLTSSGAVVYQQDGGETHYESGHGSRCWANEFRSYAQERGVEDFVNAGINGSLMTRLCETPDAWLGNGADVVVVALGTNDAGYFGTDEFGAAAAEGLAAAAQKCKALAVVSPVRDLRPESQVVQPASDLAPVLRQICEQNGYEFVDASDAVLPSQFNADGLHPSSEGSLALWDCIRTGLGLA